jgi:hypothetical protein
MDLEKLKKLREENFKAHKQKKRAYYLKNKYKNRTSIDYEKELSEGDLTQKLIEIAKKQKKHVDDRKEAIVAKLKEYQDKKKEYYSENIEKRLQYDKEYREKKKEELKEYRKQYYQKNREKILQKQKEKREKTKIEKDD